MISTCQASQPWDFIVPLEKKLDTVIGASGIDLSAGQRQRLALAQHPGYREAVRWQTTIAG